MSEKVSVIVPAYNLKDYLATCLDSILNQSYHNLEVIVVDDQSTDGTLAVAARYALADHRVRFISQHHAGLGAAYNLGLQLATGDLITFVHGDDLLDPNFLTQTTRALEDHQVDIAITNFTQFDDPRQATLYHDTTAENPLAGTHTPLEWFRYADYEPNWINRLHRTSTGKLYRRTVFDSVMFPDNNFPDDMTVWKLYLNAQRIAYLTDPLYCRRINRPDSLQQKKEFNLSVAGLEAALAILSILGADTQAIANCYRQQLQFIKDHALDGNQLWAYQDAVDKLSILDRLEEGNADER